MEDKNFPNCVALCGNHYVFRSSNWFCFGGVFDPSNNTWDPLPKPIPFSGRKFKVSPTLVSDPLHARILVHLDLFLPFVSSFYAYYPADATGNASLRIRRRLGRSNCFCWRGCLLLWPQIQAIASGLWFRHQTMVECCLVLWLWGLFRVCFRCLAQARQWSALLNYLFL